MLNPAMKMRLSTRPVRALDAETEEKGIAFVRSMLKEEHDYDSSKAHFIRLLFNEALDQAGSRLLKGMSLPMFEKTGRVRGAVGEAARVMHVSKARLGKIMRAIEGK